MNAIEFRSCLSIKVIKDLLKEDKSLYREFLVSHIERSDLIHFVYDDFGVSFEAQDGTFTEEEFEIIKEHILFQGATKIN
jgi:hypothetical protein